MRIKKNFTLKHLNTFGINIYAKLFTNFSSENELIKIISSVDFKNNEHLLIGSGSNILFTKNFEGIIIHNQIDGINIIEEEKESVIVEVGSGVIWHDFVMWSVKKKLSGIENLALIPGTVGASPIQNIGAYGVEVKDTITNVTAIDIKTKKHISFTNSDCKFTYRDSIFKQVGEKYIITKVSFRLSKKALKNISYGALSEELNGLNLDSSPKNIARAVINIRTRKLPNPNKIGNCGSFFKNPIIEISKFKSLQKKFPNIIGYNVSDKETKIAAGWLIENANLKGYRKGDAGVHEKQALVLVNHGNATGMEILDLAKNIQKKIKKIYSIDLNFEVTIL